MLRAALDKATGAWRGVTKGPHEDKSQQECANIIEQEKEKERQHAAMQKSNLVQLFDLTSDTDEVVWNEDSAGFQSQTFNIKSNR
jgi:hypothetical protein